MQIPTADLTEDIVLTKQPENSRLILKSVVGWAQKSGIIKIQVHFLEHIKNNGALSPPI